ncbi:alpha/beta fold hydrolase [Geodermatophilus sp. SYSU D00766]
MRRLRIGATSWEYLTGGSGSPALLHLPGGTGRSEASFEHLAAMEADHRVLSVTRLPATDLDESAGGLLAILDAEDVDTAVAWGTSSGGLVAQALVRRAPHRFGAMVLADTAALPRSAPADLAGWPGRVLLLQATGDERCGTALEPVRRLYPGATVRTFSGGQTASVARADRYAAAVRAFLGRLPHPGPAGT